MYPFRCDSSEVFPGGVPGWLIFGMQVQGIRARLKSENMSTNSNENDLAELCLIGLAAYFEGFARYQFASCANICPKLLANFSRVRPETAISLRDITDIDTIYGRIGFLLADGLSFSTPKEINSQYRDLLGITPFGKDESAEYDRILHDRHLIVHNAGMHTVKYLRARKQDIAEGCSRPYGDSVVITPSRVIEVATFLLDIAEKIARTTYAQLSSPANWHSELERKVMKKHVGYFKWTKDAFAPEL